MFSEFFRDEPLELWERCPYKVHPCIPSLSFLLTEWLRTILSVTTSVFVLSLAFNTAPITFRGQVAKDTSLFLTDSVIKMKG